MLPTAVLTGNGPGRTLTSAPVSTRQQTPVRRSRSVTNKRRPLEGGKPGVRVAISFWLWRFPKVRRLMGAEDRSAQGGAHFRAAFPKRRW